MADKLNKAERLRALFTGKVDRITELEGLVSTQDETVATNARTIRDQAKELEDLRPFRAIVEELLAEYDAQEADEGGPAEPEEVAAA